MVCLSSMGFIRRIQLTLGLKLRGLEHTVRVTLVGLYLDFFGRKRLCGGKR